MHIRDLWVSCSPDGEVTITTANKLAREGILIDLNNPTYVEVMDLIAYYSAMPDYELAKCVKEWL